MSRPEHSMDWSDVERRTEYPRRVRVLAGIGDVIVLTLMFAAFASCFFSGDSAPQGPSGGIPPDPGLPPQLTLVLILAVALSIASILRFVIPVANLLYKHWTQ